MVLISCVLLTFIIGIYYYSNNNGFVLQDEVGNQIINTNALTMMYETEYQSGEYQVSSDTLWPQDGYTFNAELSRCENGSVLTWDDENKKVLLQANTSDKCYVYFDVNPLLLAEYIINKVYTGVDGENGLYYHDGQGSYTNSDQEAGDNSYRYAGANPNNYVCFGSNEESCPNNNLYRIIGVFEDKIKLIKHDYANSDLLGTNGAYLYFPYSQWGGESYYYKGDWDLSLLYLYNWANFYTNIWSESQINTINLNTNYITNIGSDWSSLIAEHTWQVGGANYLQVIYNSTAKNTYNYEVGTSSANITYDAKIGLMYLNDYYYGASPTYWSYSGYTTSTYPDANGNYGADYDYRAAINENWMFMGLNEWTISRVSNDTDAAFRINPLGNIYFHYAHYGNSDSHGISLRPVFYLNPDVQYISGTGTQTDPYRIS